jgi:hypothetical protein
MKKSQINALLFAAAAAFASTAQAAIEQDFRCLISAGKKPIALEFRQIGDPKVWAAAIAYRLLQRTIIAAQGESLVLRRAVGSD